MRFEIRTLSRTISALALGAILLAGAALQAQAQPGRGRQNNRGRHLGWTIGQHRGWNRTRNNADYRLGRRDLKRHERSERRDLRTHQRSERGTLRDSLSGGHRGGVFRDLSQHQRAERRDLKRSERSDRQTFKQGHGKH